MKPVKTKRLGNAETVTFRFANFISFSSENYFSISTFGLRPKSRILSSLNAPFDLEVCLSYSITCQTFSSKCRHHIFSRLYTPPNHNRHVYLSLYTSLPAHDLIVRCVNIFLSAIRKIQMSHQTN